MSASTQQQSTSAPARHADLNCLPTEIKTHIARLCAEQDDRLREARKDLTRRYSMITPRQVYHDIRNLLTRPSSVGSLFQTSKEWLTIAAPFRFGVLHFRMLRREEFYHEMVHTRGRFYHSILLDHSPRQVELSMDVLVKLASVLPLLPNLRNVAVSDYTDVISKIETVEPYKVKFSKYAIGRVRAALRALFAQATTLSLGTESGTITSTGVCNDLDTIGWFPDLDSLHLEVSCDVLPEIVRVFNLTPKLRSLELVLRGDGQATDEACERTLEQLEADEDVDLCALPARLSFDFATFTVPVGDLVAHFRFSLVHLELRARVSDDRESAIFDTEFSALKTLTLRGVSGAFTSLIKNLHPSTVPCLEELRYLPKSYQDPDAPEMPESISTNLDTPLRRIVAYNTVDLLDYAYATGSADSRDGPTAIKRALQHGHDWYDRAVLQEDEASMVALAKALSHLELERIAHAV